MGEFMKKQRLPFYLGVIGMILGIVAIVTTIISSSISDAYALNGLAKYIVMIIIGIALILVAIVCENKMGNFNFISSIAMIAVIVIFMFVIGDIITERILLVSGLFSYNSQNMTGWSVFYATVAGIACLLVTNIFLIISAFMRGTKEA